VTEGAVLEAAAIAERRSEHPFATAIVRAADARRLPRIEPDTFDYSPGRGIVARVRGTEIVVGSRPFVTEHGLVSDSLSTLFRNYDDVFLLYSAGL
jgi:cation transport ATPase